MDDRRIRLRINGLGNLLFLAGMIAATVAVIGAFFTDGYTWQFKTFIAAMALLFWGWVFVALAKTTLSPRL